MRFFLFLVWLPFFCPAQTFEKVYSDHYEQIVTDVVEIKGGYIVSSRINDLGLSTKSKLSLFNIYGNEVQWRIFDENGINFIENISVVNDSLVLIVINSLEPNNDSSTIVYQLLDLDFNTISSEVLKTIAPRSTNETASVVASRICVNSRNELIHVFGYWVFGEKEYKGFYINKLNQLTLEISSSHYMNPELPKSLPQSIIPIGDSDSTMLFFISRTFIADYELSIIDTLNEDFTTYSNGNSANSLFLHLTAKQVGSKLVLGGNIGEMVIAQYEHDFTLKSFNEFGDRFNDKRCAGYNNCLSVNKDNNIFFAGSANYSSFLYGYESSLSMIKLDRDLNVIWENDYNKDDGYYYYPMSVLATKDGGCLLATTRNNYITDSTRLSMYLLKVDSLGNYIPNYIHETVFEKEEIVVYPNPGRNYFSFNFGYDKPSASIKLYNIFGKIVKRKSGLQKENTINTESLQNGVYIYKFYEDNLLIATGKWIKN